MADPVANGTSSTDPTPPIQTTPKTQTYTYDITMTCTGCSGAVTRALSRLNGVQSYDVSLEDQSAKVVVPGEQGGEKAPSFEEVLGKIRKTGKVVRGGAVDGVVREV